MTLLLVLGALVTVALAWRFAQLGAGRPASRSRTGGQTSATPDEAQVRGLIAAGDTIGAIKVYRRLTGLGLKESKDAIDAMAAGRALPEVRPGVPAGAATADPEILHLVRAGQVIEAIKRYRELTGAGLSEAKDAIDGLPR